MDRWPSTTQCFALASSGFFLVISRVSGKFANEPDTSWLKKIERCLEYLPRYCFLSLYLTGAFAIQLSVLKILIFSLVWAVIWFCLKPIWLCFKEKEFVSKLGPVVFLRDLPIFLTMLCLLVIINGFQDSFTLWELTLRQADNVIIDFGYPSNKTLKIVSFTLSEIAVINQGKDY